MNIEGMHCGSCAIGIQMITSQIDGVTSSEVSYEGKKGVFEFDSAKTNKEALQKAIAELGYTATVQ